MKSIVLLIALALGALTVQDAPAPTSAGDPHRWLAQLVGDWSVTTEVTTEPGGEPLRIQSTESVRSIGGLWIVAEQSATFEGEPFTSLMTLGYDERKQAFVGTWIDTGKTHLWSYVGKLDGAQKVLTLETRGPGFEDPEQDESYRDVIELVSPDHKVMTSSLQSADGTWTTFMRSEFRRKE